MKSRKEAPYLLVIGPQDQGGCLQALANTDYAYEAASNADDAIALAERRRPSLIVLDLHQHVANGLEACRALVASDATRNVPILAIAGAPADQQFMIELSVKPCDVTTLDQEIHRIVATIH